MKKKIELAQNIGNEICGGCGPDSDCGVEPEDCPRVANAVAMLERYMVGKVTSEADAYRELYT